GTAWRGGSHAGVRSSRARAWRPVVGSALRPLLLGSGAPRAPRRPAAGGRAEVHLRPAPRPPHSGKPAAARPRPPGPGPGGAAGKRDRGGHGPGGGARGDLQPAGHRPPRPGETAGAKGSLLASCRALPPPARGTGEGRLLRRVLAGRP